MTGPTVRPARPWRLVWPLVGPHRWRIALLATASFLGGVVEATLLVLLARLALAVADDADVVSLGVGSWDVSTDALFAVALALPVLRLGLSAFAAWQTATLSTGSMAELRRRLFRGFLQASWSTQSQERLGHLQELLTTSAYQALVAVRAFASGLEAVLALGALLAAALVVDFRASLAVGGAVVVLMLVLAPLRASVQRRSRAAGGANAEFATRLTEQSTMVREIRVFGAEARVADEVQATIDAHRRALARTHLVEQAAPAGYQSLALFLIVLALTVVHLAGSRDLAALGAVVLIMVRSLSYGQALQSAVQALHLGAPYLEAIDERARAYEADAVDRAGAPVAAVQELEFDGVGFAYEPGRPVLTDVSFRAHRGELIGIVGPSGSGKTTLVHLLLRLRQPTVGQIRADGRDIQGLSLDAWYEQVGFAPQEPVLLTGTVGDNIAFLRPVDQGAIEAAARLAQIHDEITTWPEGYDMPVGERGGQLSGGQRQRICLARALVAQPDILVFDEPTSSLDARSEALFRETVEARSSDAVVFVIAHRLTTLRTCDRIMVLHEGTLAAFDEPAALEASSPFYREVLRLSGLDGP